jgi:hypothetical protein
LYKPILRAIWMVSIFVALSVPLCARQTDSIMGTAADPPGAVISHARVTLTDMATKDLRTTTANAEGFFGFGGFTALESQFADIA